MSETTTLRKLLGDYNFKIANASDEYVSRRKQQMVLFLTSAAATIFASRFAYKSTISRQYVPTLFQGNHAPPLSYNFTTDAAVAVGTGTMLCGTVSSMLIFGGCWILDVSSFKEFGWKMKTMMGGYEKERQLSELPMDEESSMIQDGLVDIIEGRYDWDEEEKTE
ncbi:altered inheritance of mitochondria protein 11 [Suhomyces tanzawaensis NRRL Y-17324]|uniref:Altered inheritance of mitochondria protein 11 n=1 Tax=Suhomyces tanzawaensis NRRL Y-17324 TaxID=984487 RepID=A0A1E4SBE2_9ASCO|nr:altered inheritance of mitochondria protein 11 [Suhomyces tanzawaensis NRRL Y-17324]ODV76786.1 altered inheritance of mitochondria protein 11 [Suhomyces tanzawaensis NRRL Y-17324]